MSDKQNAQVGGVPERFLLRLPMPIGTKHVQNDIVRDELLIMVLNHRLSVKMRNIKII